MNIIRKALHLPILARHGRLLKMGPARVSPHPWDERISGLCPRPHLLPRFQRQLEGPLQLPILAPRGRLLSMAREGNK